MLNFLENHDEQRFASPQYAGDARRVMPSLVVSSMINTGPMMIYGGQELGEPALDSEGYSGYDGRTTIFDYWSIPSVRAHLNGGKCNGVLPDDIVRLRDSYARVLKLCNEEPAISCGRFFDLMYANYDNPCLDPHRDYVFMRADADDLLLIAVNFGGEDKELAVNIPRHAFDILGFPEGRARMKELLHGGRSVVKDLRSDVPFRLTLTAHGAAIWKVRRSDIA